MSVPLVEITRSGIVEETHRGSIVVIQDNKMIRTLGNAEVITPMRSTAKPFQLLPLLKNGGRKVYNLSDAEIAVMVSSHNGEKAHLETIRNLLARTNLEESLIKCGTHPAFFEWITEEVLRETGRNVTTLHNNCSGKHAGMLLLAKLFGYELDNYWEENHPIQLLILQDLSELMERGVNSISKGVDGCGVPTYNISLEELARLYYRISAANITDDEDALGVIASAMIKQNFMVAGSDRLDTDLMKTGKFIGKVGSQGIFCVSILSAKIGVAVKIESGSENAAESSAIEVLKQLNLISQDELVSLEKYWHRSIQTWTNLTVGSYKPVFDLS